MPEPRRPVTGSDAASAGFMLLTVNALCAGAGAALGALVGALVPLLLAGFFIGFGVGIWFVVRRFSSL
jgi:uncharacterized membrane protein